MTTTETIKFTAVNVIDESTEEIEAFPNQKISEVRPLIEEALDLPEWDFGVNDEPTTWNLYNHRYVPDDFLGDGQFVKDVIRPGDTIEASPSLMGGD